MTDVRIDLSVVGMSGLRRTGQSAFSVRALGGRVPEETPDHAELWAKDWQVQMGQVSEAGVVTCQWTFTDPRWLVPKYPRRRAPPIPPGYMASVPVKCSHVSDRAVLEFLAQHQGRWITWGVGYSIPTVRDAMPKGTPVKLQLAKMRRLMGRGMVGGCDCGCRGDYEVTDRGLAYIGQPRTAAYTGY